MTSVQQRLLHPHDTQWPMPNEVWLCWLGLCFAGGMFWFQQFARTAKTGSGLLCGKWRNLYHAVALSHSYRSNNLLQSEVGNTPFTGLVMIYKALRKLICTQRKCRCSFPVPWGRAISLHYTANTLILNHMLRKITLECTCKLKEERPSARMLSCKVSLEENNSLELLKENEKVGVTLDQTLTALQFTLGCCGWSGLMSEGNEGLVFH